MSDTKALFSVPLPGGQVTCTTPAERIYVLEFTSPPDNRLTTSFCQALLTALDIIELQYPHGVVITTSGIAKFYSNGLDLDHASFTPGFWNESLFALWKRILTYPMPTIALLNGHCFAGALMLAFMHDYRIMNPHRGYLCLNEVELGVPLKAPMSSVFRQKVSPQTYRTLVLEAKRFKALDALKEGIVDGVGGMEETLAFVSDLKLTSKSDKGVYGLLKEEMWRETVFFLDNWDEQTSNEEKLLKKKETEAKERRIEAWTAKKAKL